MIGFIGAGNMATAIIQGLIDAGTGAQHIIASNRSQDKLATLASNTGISTGTNSEVAKAATILVLSVKPQVMQTVVQEIADIVTRTRPIIVTLAAGLPMASYEQWFGTEHAIVRAMPNTPTLVKAGITGLYANEQVATAQRADVDKIFSPLGVTKWLDQEAQIDDIIAIAGSSPAYFFMFLEAMQAEAESYGLSSDEARSLVAQAGLGAMTLASQSDLPFATLKQNVMSKGGTTEQAIFSFERANLKGIVADAMQACKQRAKEMAKDC